MSPYLAPLAFVITTLAALPAARAASPMVVTATTWLHAAPGQNSRVLGEIGTGVAVNVLRCDSGWCQVESDQALGYVQQVLLSAAASRPFAWQPGADCLRAQHFTAEGPLALAVCPNPAPAPAQ